MELAEFDDEKLLHKCGLAPLDYQSNTLESTVLQKQYCLNCSHLTVFTEAPSLEVSVRVNAVVGM